MRRLDHTQAAQPNAASGSEEINDVTSVLAMLTANVARVCDPLPRSPGNPKAIAQDEA